jgi:hypothetical protein
MLQVLKIHPIYRKKSSFFIGVDKHESKNNKEQEKANTSACNPRFYTSSFSSQVEEYNILTIWLTKW